MKYLILTALLALTSFAHAIESCDPRGKALYKDIQIYNATEKIAPGEGLVGERLDKDLSMMKMDLSIKEKVHSIEAGFARCDMTLSDEDADEMMMSVEALKKMKNPLTTD